MAPDHLQTVCQPTRICGNPSARFFATQNRVFSANVSFRWFAASDRVILPVHIWAELPFDVLLILPARFRVITACSWVKPYAAHLWVTLYDTRLGVPARLWVNLFATCLQVKLYDTHLRVPAHLWVTMYDAHLQVPVPLNLYVALCR